MPMPMDRRRPQPAEPQDQSRPPLHPPPPPTPPPSFISHVEVTFSDNQIIRIDGPIDQIVSAIQSIRTLNYGLDPQQAAILADQLNELTARLRQSHTALQSVIAQSDQPQPQS